ncbi:MAG: histidine kinase [Flavobacteriales bacterium]
MQKLFRIGPAMVFQVLFCLMVLVCPNKSASQQLFSDSLKSLIPTMQGKDLSNLLLDIGTSTLNETGDPDSLYFYSQKALQVARGVKDSKFELYSLKFLSTSRALNQQFEQSELYLDSAMKLAVEINELSSVADIQNKRGHNLQQTGHLEEATQAYLASCKTSEQLEDWEGLTSAYHNLCSVFSILEQPKELALYVQKSLVLLPKLKDPLVKVSSLAYATGYFAENAVANPTYVDSAIFYANEGLKIAEEFNFENESGELHCALGTTYDAKGEYANSIAEYNKAKTFAEKGERPILFSVYLGMHQVYVKMNDLANARKYLDLTEKLEMTKSYDAFRVLFLESKYNFYRKTGNNAEALYALESLKQLQDSLLNEEKTTAISELEQKYNRVKNESTINELNQQKSIVEKENEIQDLQISRLIFGASLLVLVLIVIALLFWQSNINKKKRMMEIEQRLNRARMDPHFVFNVLSSIQALNMDEQRRSEVGNYIARFSRIMRQSLESTFAEMTSLESEIEFLTDYLELQKHMKAQRFNYSFDIDAELDPFEIMLPGMILQPFLENAIEHGFAGISEGGQLDILARKMDDQLYIEIRDNGQGIRTDQQKKQYPSRATQIIADRLFLLKASTRRMARYELKGGEKNGMVVKIFLPLLHQK